MYFGCTIRTNKRYNYYRSSWEIPMGSCTKYWRMQKYGTSKLDTRMRNFIGKWWRWSRKRRGTNKKARAIGNKETSWLYRFRERNYKSGLWHFENTSPMTAMDEPYLIPLRHYFLTHFCNNLLPWYYGCGNCSKDMDYVENYSLLFCFS